VARARDVDRKGLVRGFPGAPHRCLGRQMDDGIWPAGIHDLPEALPVAHVENVDLDGDRRLPGPVGGTDHLMPCPVKVGDQVAPDKTTGPGHEDAHASGDYLDPAENLRGGGPPGGSSPLSEARRTGQGNGLAFSPAQVCVPVRWNPGAPAT